MEYESIYMIRTRFVARLICISFLLTTVAVYGDSAPAEDNRPFLSRSGPGGICRGFSHLAGAPLVIPMSCLHGLVVPFQGDPEQNGTTNMVAYTVTQTIATPAYVSINTLVGTCACAIEASKGVLEVLTLGYYGQETADNTDHYDSRPYFIQLAKRIFGTRDDSRFMSLILPEEEETEEEEEEDVT
jgi:hypothetical protein